MVIEMELNMGKSTKSKTPSGWGKRHTFAILGFSGFAISYAIRFNISIAIVAMVNATVHAPSDFVNNTTDFESQICLLHTPVLVINTMEHIDDVRNMSLIQELVKPLEEQGEFNWNAEMQGYILGSFFWGYILTQLPAGVISQRYGGKWCFGIGIFLPGLLALLTPISARMGPGWIMAVRMGQGLGGGLTMASAHGLLAKWVPLEERGTLSPFIYAGMSFGSAITMLVSGYLSHYFGWETVFYTTGTVAIIWSVFWAFLVYETPSAHPSISKEELKYIGTAGVDSETNERVPTPWKEIWTSLPFWAIIIGHAAETWALYTLMIEIPTYLKTVLNFDMKQNSWISAFPYLVTWIFSIIISYLGNLLLKRKLASTATVRKLANTIALWGAAGCMVGVAYSGCNRIAAVTFLTLALGTLGGFYSGVLCNHIDIAPRFASILMGITNTAATSPGFLAPLVAGSMLKGNSSLEQWRKVFLLGAGITFIGNLFFILFAKGEEQKWNTPASKKEPPGDCKPELVLQGELKI